MEIKYGEDKDYTRNVFERVLGIPNKLKQVKHYFKKYLDYEQKNGDDKRQAYVKKKAIQYVERIQAEEGE